MAAWRVAVIQLSAQAPGVPPVTINSGIRTLDAAPLHHYAFEGANVVDLVGSANGTLVNGALVRNGLLSLDGRGAYVEFGENLIPVSNYFSVAFFARELSPTSDRAEVISQGKWFGPGFYIGYYTPIRGLRVGDEWQQTGLEFPNDRQWHHFALTVNADASSFYIDGKLVASSEPLHIVDGGNHTRLGRQYEPWQEYFHGEIAELWVYEEALTSEEVASLAALRPKLLNQDVADQVTLITGVKS